MIKKKILFIAGIVVGTVIGIILFILTSEPFKTLNAAYILNNAKIYDNAKITEKCSIDMKANGTSAKISVSGSEYMDKDNLYADIKGTLNSKSLNSSDSLTVKVYIENIHSKEAMLYYQKNSGMWKKQDIKNTDYAKNISNVRLSEKQIKKCIKYITFSKSANKNKKYTVSINLYNLSKDKQLMKELMKTTKINAYLNNSFASVHLSKNAKLLLTFDNNFYLRSIQISKARLSTANANISCNIQMSFSKLIDKDICKVPNDIKQNAVKSFQQVYEN